jgi:hypothetical protein
MVQAGNAQGLSHALLVPFEALKSALHEELSVMPAAQPYAVHSAREHLILRTNTQHRCRTGRKNTGSS